MTLRTFWARLGGALCLLLVLAACGVPATASPSTNDQTPSTPTPDTTRPDATTPPATTPDVSTTPDLPDGSWQLIEYGPAGTPIAVVPGSNVTITLDPDGKISGNASCNSYFGSYTLDGQSITISGVGSTEMACADEKLMQQEAAYLAALQAATGIGLAGDTLTIDYAGGQLRFSKVVPPATSPLEGTNWQLKSFINGDSVSSTVAGSTVTAVFADGKISGSAGCNQYNAEYTLTDQTLAVSPIVTTRMACEDALMGQEQQFTDALGTATGLLIDGNQLRLDYPGGALVFRAAN